MNPKYKDPPIREAVFEVRFEPLINIEKFVLSKEIEKAFPVKQIRTGVTIEIKPDEKGHLSEKSTLNEAKGFVFKSKDGNDLFLISENNFSIHRTLPYLGWEKFKENIKLILNFVPKKIGINKITRLGMRYINEISIHESNFKIDDYFQLKPNYKSNNKENLSFSIGIVYKNKKTHNTTRIQLAQQETETEDKRLFVFDIDCSSTESTMEQKKILDWAEGTHDEIIEVFQDSLHDTLKKTFNKQLP